MQTRIYTYTHKTETEKKSDSITAVSKVTQNNLKNEVNTMTTGRLIKKISTQLYAIKFGKIHKIPWSTKSTKFRKQSLHRPGSAKEMK